MLNTGRKAMLRSREERLEILHDVVGKSGVGVGMRLSWLERDEYRHQQVVRGDGIWQTPEGAGGSGTGKVSLPCFGWLSQLPAIRKLPLRSIIPQPLIDT